jgi:hypothetical protein
MKKIITVVTLIAIIIIMSSCNPLGYMVYETEYDDKEISTILFAVNGNWIPDWREKLIDFENLTYSTRHTIAESYRSDYINEYNEGLYSDTYAIIQNFSESELSNYKNALVEHGIYNLEERYNDSGVYDGNSWKLEINFKDGTSFVSSGYVENPIQANQIDLDCYELFADQFFGTLDRSYFEPPELNLSLDYNQVNGSYSFCTGAQICSYEWRKFSKSEDLVSLYNDGNLYSYRSDAYENTEYVQARFTLNEKCKEIKIYKMDLNGENKSLVDSKKKFNNDGIILEVNKIYVIDITFDNGSVEYAFAYIA